MRLHRPRTLLHLAALRDRDIDLWFVVGSNGGVFDFSQDEHAVDDAAEHNMLSVQKVAFRARQKKLASVRILSTVSHRQNTSLIVFIFEAFVGERRPSVD